MCVYIQVENNNTWLIMNVIIKRLKNKTISADTAFFLGDEDTAFFPWGNMKNFVGTNADTASCKTEKNAFPGI